MNIAANSALDGGASFNPITDDLMRTYHDSQQVAVMINNIPTKCADCTFLYNSAATPAISTIDVADTANIQISGSGFGNRSEGNIVMIGDVPCSILTSTTTSISCAAGKLSFYLSLTCPDLYFLRKEIISLQIRNLRKILRILVF